jgi:hypothetical protein
MDNRIDNNGQRFRILQSVARLQTVSCRDLPRHSQIMVTRNRGSTPLASNLLAMWTYRTGAENLITKPITRPLLSDRFQGGATRAAFSDWETVPLLNRV